MYVINENLEISEIKPIKDLEAGKWYVYPQGQGYADYILARKNETNDLSILHAWIKEDETDTKYYLTFAETPQDTATTVTLSPGLEKATTHSPSKEWDDLSIPQIYEDVYLELYEDYMTNTLAAGFVDSFQIESADIDEIKDEITIF